jgi:hypothetical protein
MNNSFASTSVRQLYDAVSLATQKNAAADAALVLEHQKPDVVNLETAILAPNPDVIKAFLEAITENWADLEEAVRLEIRLVGDGPVATRQFVPDADGLKAAVAYVVESNTIQRRNAYAVISPVRNKRGAAKDEDVVASLFCWADADDQVGLTGIRNAPIKPHMTVTTGTVPHERLHAYWRLKEPNYDLGTWRETQKAIAVSLKTDRAVINPSSLMRIPGTISRPNSKKRDERGYVDELVR